jgi:hypothetical protein
VALERGEELVVPAGRAVELQAHGTALPATAGWAVWHLLCGYGHLGFSLPGQVQKLS